MAAPNLANLSTEEIRKLNNAYALLELWALGEQLLPDQLLTALGNFPNFTTSRDRQGEN